MQTVFQKLQSLDTSKCAHSIQEQFLNLDAYSGLCRKQLITAAKRQSISLEHQLPISALWAHILQ